MSKLEANNILSICIPTYNGAEKVHENLTHLIPIVAKHNIIVYILDNASTDNTRDIVSEFKKQYEYIIYDRNDENIGADRNFEKILKQSQTKYSWLLGDDDLIYEEALNKVIDAIKENVEYSIICLNVAVHDGSRIKNIDDCVFENYNELMVNIGPHLTQMSILIFNTSILELVDVSNYYDTWFLQTCIVYNASVASKLPVKWINSHGFFLAKSNSCSWSQEFFYTFTTRLYNSALLFDDIYTKKSKKKYVRTCFGYFGDPKWWLVRSRMNKEVTFLKVIKYRKSIRWAIPFKYRIFVTLLCFIPRKLLVFVRDYRRKRRLSK